MSRDLLVEVLALAPTLVKLDLNFCERITPATLRTLFDVPDLARLDAIELSNHVRVPAIVKTFFASPQVCGVRRLDIDTDYAVGFDAMPWPRLERLLVHVIGDAAGRKNLARILGAELPALRTLELDPYKLGAPGLTIVTRSPVFRQLTAFAIRRSDAGIGDAGIAVLAKATPTLDRLAIPVTDLSAKGIAGLAKLARKLDVLELGWIETDDAGLRALARISNIATAGIATPISTAILATFLAGTGATLRALWFREPTDDHCEVLAQARLPRLQSLALREGTIGAAGARALARLVTVEELDLQQNLTLGDAAGELVAMPRLRELGLEFCGIGETGARALAAWPKRGALTTLQLNGNYIVDKQAQAALQRRFPKTPVHAMIGYQHARPKVPPAPVVEPEPPVQRKRPPLPRRRRDWKAGLRELIGRAHFASWDGHVAPELIARSEQLIDRCAEGILALGEAAPATVQRAVLKRCITGFNRRADDLYTIEAEDIVETFHAVVRYTKLAREADLADEWRDF